MSKNTIPIEFVSSETIMNPLEICFMILFMFIIIVVAFVLLQLVVEYYKYVFSEP